MDTRDLVVAAAFVDEGPTMKRIRPRAQGRAYRVRKRSNHITIIMAPPNEVVDATGNRSDMGQKIHPTASAWDTPPTTRRTGTPMATSRASVTATTSKRT